VILNCSDSDAAVLALLSEFPAAHDIEISSGSLEEVFLQLTVNDHERKTIERQEVKR
jgi:ABC-2 type transport system ATP-binding protein